MNQQPQPHLYISWTLEQAIRNRDKVAVARIFGNKERTIARTIANSANSAGRTAIQLAMLHKSVHIAKILAAKGADLTKVSDGWNLLHFAAKGGRIGCIKWVLASTNLDVNSTTTNGRTAIVIAFGDGPSNDAPLF
jgi:ankyrin repeat protein